MKRAKKLLALFLALSMCLGLTVMTSATDTTNELAITKIAERADGGIDVYFSEDIAIGTNLWMGLCLTNGTDIPQCSTRQVTEVTNGNMLSVTAEMWGTGTGYTLCDFYRRNLLNNGHDRDDYRIALYIKDVNTGSDDGVMDLIYASADNTKKLKATHASLYIEAGTRDVYTSTNIEYAMPVLMSVDKVDTTHYTLNFSEDVAVASGTRLALRLLDMSKGYVSTANQASYQQIVDANGGFAYSVSGSSVTVTVPQTYIRKIQNFYVQTGCVYAIHLQLIDSTANDSPVRMNMITAVDDGAGAFGDYDGGTGSDGVSWNITELMCPNAMIGDMSYDAVTDALAAAGSGDTVSLFRNNDCADETLVVPAGVTLDLNRCNLTVANLISFGDVIDSVGGGTLVMSEDRTEALLSLLPSNSMLPLYNATAGGYQFFSQTLVGGGPVDGTATSVKFGVKLSFTDTAAYELLKSGQVKLGLELEVIRDGHANNLTYIFKDATVGIYADSVLANSAGNYYIVLQLSGLEAGDTLNAVPMLETADGKSFDVKLTAEGLTYTSVA